jgi:hypothetical protein
MASHVVEFARAIESAATAPLLERIKELERELTKPCRHDLQAEGNHPAPCAKFCEAQAFKITIRGLERELEAVRKDAERYRWLCTMLGETQLPTLIERITSGYVADYKPSIDAAIDAAKEHP